MKKTKIIFSAGARPNFMKIAALLRRFRKLKECRCPLVHTGQHYDFKMSQSFFDDLEIPKPDYFLEVGSGTHAAQTAAVMSRFERVCFKEKPDALVVVGDVNSTLACALAAKKIGVKVAHVEAGLRSFDMAMPEEINRVMTDSISDFLFVTEPSAVLNLKKEGRRVKDIYLVGNTMIDSLVFGIDKLRSRDPGSFPVSRLKKELGGYGVVTLHRPSNVDDKKTLSGIMRSLDAVARRMPLVFPAHPRTRKNIRRFGLRHSRQVRLIEPLGYLEFLFLYRDAQLILTDSGGLQEEATYFGIPCLTLRENTERPITVTEGTNTVVGSNPSAIVFHADRVISGRYKTGSVPGMWDGKASSRISRVLLQRLKE